MAKAEIDTGTLRQWFQLVASAVAALKDDGNSERASVLDSAAHGILVAANDADKAAESPPPA